MSKISDYKFEELVLEMRARGLSTRKIAESLNAKIPQDDEPISEMAVFRWLKSNEHKARLPIIDNSNPITITEEEGKVDEEDNVNPYIECLKLVNDCDYQIELLKKRIEMVRLQPHLKDRVDPQSVLANYIARKQALLADVAKYQKELASFTQVQETLKMVFNTLQKVSPEAYEQFKKEITEQQAIRSILK